MSRTKTTAAPDICEATFVGHRRLDYGAMPGGSLVRFGVGLLLIFCLLGSVFAAEAPRLRAAVGLLERARAAEHSLRLLHEAREEVRNATAHRGVRRTAALEAIGDAIAVAKNGRDPDAPIDRALSYLRAQISSR